MTRKKTNKAVGRGKRNKAAKPSIAGVPAAEGERIIRLRKYRNDRGAGAQRRFRPKELKAGDWVWRWDGWYAQAIHVRPHRWQRSIASRSDGPPAVFEVDGVAVCWRSACKGCGASYEAWRAISTMPRPFHCSACYFVWLQKRQETRRAGKAKRAAASIARRAKWVDVISTANLVAKSASDAE